MSLYRQGVFDAFGVAREKNVYTGVESLEKAAEYNYAPAIETLAYLYLKRGDANRSETYLEKLSSLKSPKYLSIAEKYTRGSDGVTDTERAKFILEFGSKKGDNACAEKLKDFSAFVKKSKAKTLFDVSNETSTFWRLQGCFILR